jgi:hypothetical protein
MDGQWSWVVLKVDGGAADGPMEGRVGWILNDTRSFPALDVSEFIAFDACQECELWSGVMGCVVGFT